MAIIDRTLSGSIAGTGRAQRGHKAGIKRKTAKGARVAGTERTKGGPRAGSAESGHRVSADGQGAEATGLKITCAGAGFEGSGLKGKMRVLKVNVGVWAGGEVWEHGWSGDGLFGW